MHLYLNTYKVSYAREGTIISTIELLQAARHELRMFTYYKSDARDELESRLMA